MEIKEEKFSLIKFFSGFGNIGKIIFILCLFTVFTLIKDKVVPRIGSLIERQEIQTYIEAPKYKPVQFFGLKINKIGLGIVYEK